MSKKLLGALAVAAASLAGPIAAQANSVDLTYNLDLSGMSSGTCPDGSCGTVTVTGDTTSSLNFVVDLATGVSFHANHTGSSGTGDFFYFDLTGPAMISFSGIGVDGSIGTTTYSYNTPVSGSFMPNPGDFPGPYNYAGTCTNDTAGKICNSPFEFTVSGASVATPFLIGAPQGGGLFPDNDISFVADLSISGNCGTVSCTAGTGFVGSGPGMIVTVPETSTWAMMALGFAGLGLAGYRKTKTSRPFLSA